MVPYTHNRAAGEKQHNASNYQLSLFLLLFMHLEFLMAMLVFNYAPVVVLTVMEKKEKAPTLVALEEEEVKSS